MYCEMHSAFSFRNGFFPNEDLPTVATGAAMPSTICIFEDETFGNFLPLVYTRPVYDLKCGTTSLRERIQRSFPKARVVLHCREYLAEYLSLRNPDCPINKLPDDHCLFLNGRILEERNLARLFPVDSKRDQLYLKDGQVVAARLSGSNLRAVEPHLKHPLSAKDFGQIAGIDIDVKLVSYPWDLVHRNGDMLIHDGEDLLAHKRGSKGKIWKGAYVVAPKKIMIGKGSNVMPGAVLDATDGPIIIGDQVKVFSQATIIGPSFIGSNSLVKVGASIYEGCTIGPRCKVGGEIDSSIVHGYSNKQHSGFLGHSYVGKWVNLGADTNTSDLKNNYGHVRVTIAGRQINTGLQFFGLIMGDHTKSAINSMFNTGAVVGVSCNVAMAGFPPKWIPSFSWVTGEGLLETYDLQRAREVARRVMERRHVVFSTAEEELFKRVFDATREERSYPDIDG